jgi:putative flavoprotein involved in K+ transport
MAGRGTANEMIAAWLGEFGSTLAAGDVRRAVGLFGEASYWRDLACFTWNIATMEGPAAVEAMIRATLPTTRPGGWALFGEASDAGGTTEGWITFETAVARGFGHVRLRGNKCYTLLTTAQELKGHEERRGPTRDRGVEHGAIKGRKSWLERRVEEQAQLGYAVQPYCVIVGGGQGGIGLAARLKQLGVPTLIIEKNARAGDSWRSRYKSLCLHDPVWYDHMPYLPFPDHWPVFTPKDKLGDWLETYVGLMELDYWTSAVCRSAQYDEARREWTVLVDRAGQEVVLHPRHLVLATGMSGFPNLPQFPGTRDFQGEQHHSSRHPGGERYAGKTCVVVGSNNSAHDIAADLWEHGADVTMIQRSSTLVARSETLTELSSGRLYSEAALKRGITTEKADLMTASVPYRILPDVQRPIVAEMKKRDAAFYERLASAGFMLDFGEDDTGLFMKYLRRGSGYYIDVGGSDLIARGEIKLKSRVAVERIGGRSVHLSDGSELPADLIVYATGYGSMNQWAGELISPDVARKVGTCWGIGSATTYDPGPWEGELRNMWKPTRQEGLWFHGGNLAQSRFYSQFLALQLKARMEGLATPVYGMPEVHQPS